MRNLSADPYAQALAAYTAGRLDEAGAVCERVLGSPQGGGLQFLELLAGVRFGQKRFADVVQLLDLQLQYAPSNPTVHFNRGLALAELERFEAAILSFRKALEFKPTYRDARSRLANTLLMTGKPGDFRESRAILKSLLGEYPKDAATWSDYGKACANSTMEPEALEAFRKAIELDPNLASAHSGLGITLLEMGQVQEAADALDRAVELNPGWDWLRGERDRLRARLRPNKKRLARYPRTTGDFVDLQRYIEKFILPDLGSPEALISENTRIFTMGSCFAMNIAKALDKLAVASEYVWCPEEINNTYANRNLLDWVVNGPSPKTACYEAAFKEGYRLRLAEVLRLSEVVVISLGVAPCFFDRATGEFVDTFGSNINIALSDEKYRFRTTTVAENVENLRAILGVLRSFNPASSVFLTVSPVPLKSTFERGSAVVADCVSKSTMRVAAHELLSLVLPNVHYWPSFEMVRWYGGHAGTVFGVDDDSAFHVSQNLIETIMFNFVRHFGSPQLIEAAERRYAALDPEPAKREALSAPA